jgi:rare lipoprotein A
MRKIIFLVLITVAITSIYLISNSAYASYYVNNSIKRNNYTGVASWYGKRFHGRKTAAGERYNMFELTAAHKTLPLGTLVKVTSLDNGREVIVRVNDRGPYIPGRVIDLSLAAACELRMVEKGLAEVKLEILPRSN